MRILYDFANPGRSASTLVVLLPGALQQPEGFVQAGFIDAVRKRNLPIDLALVDPGLHYIGDAVDGTALRRIHESVMQPALLQQYQAIWFGGISIGGFMALAFAERYRGMASGLCLLAPYPGERMLSAEIKTAGGIRKWNDSAAPGDDADRRIWRWLKCMQAEEHADCGMRGGSIPEVYLGYGRDDRFAPGQSLMAQALGSRESNNIDTIAGGHEWPVWRKLWENFLDRTAEPGKRPDRAHENIA